MSCPSRAPCTRRPRSGSLPAIKAAVEQYFRELPIGGYRIPARPEHHLFRSHYRHHIAPSIGPKHVKDWTRDDLRTLSRDLDDKVRAGELAWKTAINIWGTATKICSDASESKRDAIRCRPDDPSDKVRGPDEGDEIGLQFLYPSEFLQFVSCADVPLRWRQLVALAVYSYCRDGELGALELRDVDDEHGRLNVTKALENRTGELGSPKGGRGRSVPLEAPLGPLVRALRGRFPSHRDMARGLRRWLARAGVNRHELHHWTPTSRPIRFHDLRGTGITWLAVRREAPLEIQERAGHQNFETTQRYIRLADRHRQGFGTVFPPLPPELVESTAEVSITSFDHVSASSGVFSRFSGADGTRSRCRLTIRQKRRGITNRTMSRTRVKRRRSPRLSGCVRMKTCAWRTRMRSSWRSPTL